MKWFHEFRIHFGQPQKNNTAPFYFRSQILWHLVKPYKMQAHTLWVAMCPHQIGFFVDIYVCVCVCFHHHHHSNTFNLIASNHISTWMHSIVYVVRSFISFWMSINSSSASECFKNLFMIARLGFKTALYISWYNVECIERINFETHTHCFLQFLCTYSVVVIKFWCNCIMRRKWELLFDEQCASNTSQISIFCFNC